MNKKIVILYHKNCTDGFGAAWAGWKKFKNKAEYIAVDPQILPKKRIINKDIYILDNCYPKQILEKLKKDNKKVIVIDHHISNKEIIKNASAYVFNNNHSGAVLAWKYFNPNKKTPILLRYIEDQDLWNFKIRNTRDINALSFSRNTFTTK